MNTITTNEINEDTIQLIAQPVVEEVQEVQEVVLEEVPIIVKDKLDIEEETPVKQEASADLLCAELEQIDNNEKVCETKSSDDNKENKESDVREINDKTKPYDNNKTILVLSGGGIKGLALVGCLKALEKLNILNNFKTMAGTSVGALITALYVIGYSPDELYVFIKKFNFGSLKNIKLLNLFTHLGVDDGCKMQVMIERMIVAKGHNADITLETLYKHTNITILMTTVCLNTCKPVYLSHKTHPDLPLSTAIRMSTCIPWFYVPISYKGYLYTDGGCIDNYPIHLFKNKIEKVIGIYLVDSYSDDAAIDNIESFSLQVFKCFMKGVAFNSIKGYEAKTVYVNLKDISATDYDIDVNKKRKLCLIGLKSVINYFKNQ
jgi:predicted acylesterase/phospholipase RssA